MTVTAEPRPTQIEDGVAERVRKIREAQDARRESRRRLAQTGTAAARADLHDRRHADPVPVHAVLLDVVVEPGSSRVHGNSSD